MTAPPASQRQYFRSLRRSLSPAQQTAHARQLARHVCASKPFRNARSIACYLANDGEIDPVEIIETAWSRGQKVYLPVLSPLGNRLVFGPYKPGCAFIANRYGIPEPACSPRHWRRARQLDLLLVPLVAFDDDGNRLGMGGGFYDRTLAFRKLRTHHQRPLLVGLAHEAQRADKLQAASWDIPLDAIATEAGIRPAGRTGG